MFGFFKGGKKGDGGKCQHQALGYKSMLDVPIGENAVIKQHHSRGAIRQRLLDLGFVPGRDVKVLRVATLGCPIELKVSGYCVTLRRTEAQQIEVK